MRPIWSGAITFGLVTIPIKLYSATEEHGFSLDMLHKKDLSPIRYARVCKAEEKEVPYNEIVKGYEVEDGKYVILTDKDFEDASPQNTKTIEIHSFTLEHNIDSIYFEKPYLLEPGKGASKPYTLLREALKKSKKVGVATFVLHNREHVGIVKASDRALLVQTLRYHNEIRDFGLLELPLAAKANPKELELALMLIDKQTEEFKPTAYKDNYHEKLKQVVEAKKKGKKIQAKAKEPEITEVQDLMTKLKASLQKSKVA